VGFIVSRFFMTIIFHFQVDGGATLRIKVLFNTFSEMPTSHVMTFLSLFGEISTFNYYFNFYLATFRLEIELK